jgi:hypothetical protein
MEFEEVLDNNCMMIKFILAQLRSCCKMYGIIIDVYFLVDFRDYFSQVIFLYDFWLVISKLNI